MTLVGRLIEGCWQPPPLDGGGWMNAAGFYLSFLDLVSTVMLLSASLCYDSNVKVPENAYLIIA
jgi:hypothetical protein